jgi:hypothetical protein
LRIADFGNARIFGGNQHGSRTGAGAHMNVVDSSAWLEYLADGPNAEHFSDPLIDIDNLIVPTICIYKVFKAVLRQRGEDADLQAVALMKLGLFLVLMRPERRKVRLVDCVSFSAMRHHKIEHTYIRIRPAF